MSNNASIFSDNAWTIKLKGKFLIYRGKYLEIGLNREVVRKLVCKRGALGAMWTYDCGRSQEGPWYRYICDTVDYDIDRIKSKKGRYYVRCSLKNCTVRPVDYEWLADNAYEVHVNAASRYSNFVHLSKKNFRAAMLEQSSEPGREAMGVFIDRKLVAFATLLICEESVRVYGSQFDPAYSRAYPMYALYYTIAHHYLRERGCQAADNGCRALRHDTNIGDFLVRLGWRKQYCRLGLYLRWHFRVALALARTFRKVCKLLLPERYYTMLESLLLSQEIAKATRKL